MRTDLVRSVAGRMFRSERMRDGDRYILVTTSKALVTSSEYIYI